MAEKKKPEGKEWEEFIREWNATDHAGKVALAMKYGVRYDTAKHWVSDALCAKPKPKKIEDLDMTMSLEELLNSRPSVNLDFVSFDLESSNLNADFSVFLTAVIKPFGK